MAQDSRHPRNPGKVSSGGGKLCLEQLSQKALHAWCPCSAEREPGDAILCARSRQALADLEELMARYALDTVITSEVWNWMGVLVTTE